MRIPLLPRRRLRGFVLLLCLQLVGGLFLLASLALASSTPSPHFFGPTNTNCLQYGDGHTTCSYHNDTSSTYKDLAGEPAWYTWKWPSTSSTYYNGLFKFDSSFPTSWRDAARAAITTWNRQSYYSPVMTETTGSIYDIKFVYSSSSTCSSASVWYACAGVNTGSTSSKANAEAQQWWTLTLNPAWPWGIGTSGRFDVQSMLTNELGHAWYLNHNPSWSSGVVQLNSCYWGTTTCRDSFGRSVSCANCGNRRSVLPGDQLTLGHIYGALSPTPTKTPLPLITQDTTQTSEKPAGPPDTFAVPNDSRPVAASYWIAEGSPE